MTVNSRNVAILVFDDIEVLDFAGPFEVFNVAGEILPPQPYAPFFTHTVGPTAAAVVARGGLRVTPHFSIADCPAPDVLVVPGGMGARRLLKNDAVLGWIRASAARAQWVLSVCTGSLVLAQAGLLQERSATTHHIALDRLAELSPTTQVVRDQRFVMAAGPAGAGPRIATSGGISAGIDLSLAVVRELLGDAAHAAVVKQMEWDWFKPQGPG
jgi:transcriptional regulator GlxA family with amidase domain